MTSSVKIKNVDQVLKENYMPYAMSVILSRAIPDINGFKPSHVKLLYTMYKMGLFKNRTKSANIVGQTMKLNPHGDMAIYETMVRLTTGNESLLVPLVDSKGNFGKVYSKDVVVAAPRYTEAKLSDIYTEVFRDIDKNVVDFVDNYDNTMKEPVTLPVSFPNILANPNTGIAVGMASNICSFNLSELCEATVEFIKDKNIDVMKYLKAPDFSTGGQLIYNKKELKKIYETGRGSFKIRARYSYDKGKNCINIHEIPYTTTVEAIIDKIVDLIKENKIREITDIVDGTDVKGLNITINLKRNVDPDALMAKLYKLTTLEDTFSCNFNILVDRSPKVMGIKEILNEWIKFRQKCIKRSVQFDIDKKTKELHFLNGLKRVLLDIDEAIRIIRHSKDEEIIHKLCEKFGVDEEQANSIANLRLRNINEEYILNRINSIKKLENEIKELKSILEDDNKINNIIIDDLERVKEKYGQPRKTEIVYEDDIVEIEQEEMIENYNVRYYLTEQGYLKKVPLTSLRSNSEHRLREGDKIISEINATNRSDLILFSNKGVAYKQKSHEINDTRLSSLGEYLPNILDMDEDEKIIHIIATEDYKKKLMIGFANGRVAAVDLGAYETKTNRSKLLNAISMDSPITNMFTIDKDIDVVCASSINKVLITNTGWMSPKKSRNTSGVIVMRDKNDSVMTLFEPLEKVQGLEDVEYYRVSKSGVGKYLKKTDKIEII